MVRGQVDTALDVLREGDRGFRELMVSGDAGLVDKLAKLDPDRLRSIVFERSSLPATNLEWSRPAGTSCAGTAAPDGAHDARAGLDQHLLG